MGQQSLPVETQATPVAPAAPPLQASEVPAAASTVPARVSAATAVASVANATAAPPSPESTPASVAVATRAGSSVTPPPAAAATQAPAAATPAASATSTAVPAGSATSPAPACTPGVLTPSMTEGPYYKENPPESAMLAQPAMTGTRLMISGYVLDASCRPVPGARVDFWQADAEGVYDNSGYTLRGHQVTDALGRYTVETVVPGLYPGRTRHIHVKVTPPGGATLTTQLFFPDEAQNARYAIFAEQSVMDVRTTPDGESASFNFVVNG